MKKTSILFLILMVYVISAMGQAKKPTLMVVPSDSWCKEHKFEQAFDNQGTTQMVPDYKAAISTDKQLNAIISKINILMADRGFPLKDLQQTLKSIVADDAQDRLTTSKNASAITESPVDRLNRQAKADIILEIDWTVNTIGPKSSITYNLRALDAYTNKQVAGAEGTGKGSFSVELPVLLEEAVLDHMDSFTERLQTHFDDLLTNGREIILDMRVFEGSNVDFEKEYGDYELTEIIDNWLAENCVNHRFGRINATDTRLQYEQVRIPIYRANGMAQDTRGFARELARYLGKAPYNIPIKVDERGLGKCVMIFGEK